MSIRVEGSRQHLPFPSPPLPRRRRAPKAHGKDDDRKETGNTAMMGRINARIPGGTLHAASMWANRRCIPTEASGAIRPQMNGPKARQNTGLTRSREGTYSKGAHDRNRRSEGMDCRALGNTSPQKVMRGLLPAAHWPCSDGRLTICATNQDSNR